MPSGPLTNSALAEDLLAQLSWPSDQTVRSAAPWIKTEDLAVTQSEMTDGADRQTTGGAPLSIGMTATQVIASCKGLGESCCVCSELVTS
jgi:hypothetical protein